MSSMFDEYQAGIMESELNKDLVNTQSPSTERWEMPEIQDFDFDQFREQLFGAEQRWSQYKDIKDPWAEVGFGTLPQMPSNPMDVM